MLVVAVVCAWGATSAAARVNFAEYRGSAVDHQVLTTNGIPTTYNATLTWDLKVYYDEDTQNSQYTFVAQGSVSVTGGSTCQISQGETHPRTDGDLVIGGGDSDNTVTVTGGIPDRFGGTNMGEIIYSSGGTGCRNGFGYASLFQWDPNGTWEALCGRSRPDPQFESNFNLTDAPANHTEKWDGTQNYSVDAPDCPITNSTSEVATRTIDATLTVGTGSTPRHHPRSPGYEEALKRFKGNARSDFRDHDLEAAEATCLPVATGLGLTGAGILVTALPGAAGTTLTVAGALMASTNSLICGPAIQRAVKDYKTWKDPPVGQIASLAQPADPKHVSLPACSSKAHAFCVKLRAADIKLILASERAAGATDAIEITISRAHTALSKHKQKLAKMQEKHLKVLDRVVRSDQVRDSAAGRGVAKVLRDGHILYRLDDAQSAQELSDVERDMRSHGVTTANIDAIDPGALTAAPTDLLVLLSHL